MASIIARRAAISGRAFSTTTRRFAQQADPALKEETKRNPELAILGGVMVFALGGAGLYFGSTPTSSTSENEVGMAKSGMPWETGSTEGKYRYHPGGDNQAAPKDAPSAVNVVVVPDVNLPKHLHEKYNKWGKDGY
ncbi:Uu.00g112880.m01.CDS01 [Anthostomella pinea]|uniref:Uu.00g112880.m01.CDS01 n=1 Tax=Anthostomella pinea TaxID=933095 RepID=A0AAI8VGE9_9PEZI|nr:Uu.00g112880.m01.CDS01 [Anthostomella pinea]